VFLSSLVGFYALMVDGKERFWSSLS